jgi:dienelactone hydrolase
MHPHRWAVILLALVVVAPAAEARSARVKVRVVPITSSADQAVHVRITGLHAVSSAEVRLRVSDARGKVWHSSASFRADAHGSVDLDRSAALAGSYRGRWGMGLLASLTTPTRSAFYPFEWRGARAQTFRIDVRVRGRLLASRRFRRAMPGAVDEQPISIADAGFRGSYHTRRGQAPRLPGILLLGGSEGGLPGSAIPTMFAARGYPTLGLAYFRAPGLPQTLARIPLEYFERALTWLRAQPQVDPSRIVVIGVSRGSEAAQLLGVYYPSLVSGVVASVPSNAALCGFPDCSQPAWMLNGAPLPYTQQFNNPYPTDNPDAVIPDERIHGPLFAVCGGSDLVWVSCPYASAIMDRLSAHGHPYRDVSYAYPRAGHFVGGFLPYSPIAPRALYLNPADEQAREAVWPNLLSFLARL